MKRSIVVLKEICFAAILIASVAPFFSAASPTFTNGVSQGTISIPELNEASGLVASRNNPNVLWVHNDSGDSARIFAIDTQGRKLGIYTLPGASNTDYEDIGMGPGPVTNVLYIYVGDIGDNGESRSNIKIYQIPEPAVYQSQYLQPKTNALKGVRTITLTYPNATNNAESLFVDPWTGDLFIATKQNSVTRIYTAPKAQLDTNNSFTLTFVRTNSFNIASAADISPTGREIIIRQEEFARLWTRTNGQNISNALTAAPVNVPVAGTANGEENGEAVAFDYLGNGYYTVSESSSSQPLYYFARISDDRSIMPRTLITPGSTWKYLDNGTDQGTNWQSTEFDDSSWSIGVAQLGYGDGDEKTIVSFGGNANNKYVTTYFRKTFLTDNVDCITNLTLKLVVDDGAGVFLNGAPVVHENLSTSVAYNTLASAMPVALQSTWRSYDLNPAILQNGTNTLAVEIHQSSITSSNISFDLQLIASDWPCATSIEFTNSQPRIHLFGPTNTSAFIHASETLTNWSPIGSLVLTNGLGIFVDTQATNFDHRFYKTK